ncbi:E3 ubiquitin ligase TRAF3IP2 [Syngnathus scovelli]|uniref:E3 ubiquitin ligase TRAF3IP2 n=1 Tax=Syngnathus scovelli TaxID=161590 RepID=UPI00210F8D21|nr:E3 ubiquitin ligase TRAF3IP2 [Syngnathus scovelli]XP_049612049.1 E3 ubiquitin ligase TRAF3IP2 [Syngnathus scovelli]
MATSKSLWTHRSIPIEVDESMPPSSLDFDCQKFSGPENNRSWEQTEELDIHVKRERLLHHYFQSELKNSPTSGQGASVWPQKQGENNHCGFMEPQNRLDCSLDDGDGLEQPLPLMSNVNAGHYVPSRFQAALIPGQCLSPKQENCLGRDLCPHQRARPFERTCNHPGNRMQYHNIPNPRQVQPGAAPKDVMCEVSLDYRLQADPLPATREIRKTVTLPDEYRNVFITYSVDTAEEMTGFVKFLTSQGFKPAIDIFDTPAIRMGFTRWMDRFLNDKSVLIIVAISPKYKEDVEGDNDDEHGLHTKYIHNQIQNEFIQQGCLNFRLIPVLFCNATKRHVPSWLQNTRIYRWPLDMQDLLLRLLREERYIIPQPEASLTLTIRPL